MTNTQQIPHSQEAEEAVLGSVLLESSINPDDFKVMMIELSEILKADDFYRPQNRTIYKQLMDMWNAELPIDIVTLQQKLKDNDLIDKVGGLVYLDQLFDSVPASENCNHYAKIVKDKSDKRQLMDACRSGYTDAKTTDDFQKALNGVASKIMDISLGVTKQSARSFADVIPEYKQILRSEVENLDDKKYFFPTGIDSLDGVITGLAPGFIDFIAARPNVGKSAIGLQVADNVASQGHPVVFMSLEMTQRTLINRLISRRLQIDSGKFLQRNLDQDQLKQVDDLNIEDLPMVIEDKLYSITDIWNRCRYWKYHFGDLGLVVIDYIQMMSGHSDIYKRISANIRKLAQMAKELDCAILVLSQLGRGTGKEPIMKDMEGSGVLEQVGDRIMLMYRNGEGDEYRDNIIIKIEKNRHSARGGKLPLILKTRFGEFTDLLSGVSRVSQNAPSKLTLPSDEDEFRGDL